MLRGIRILAGNIQVMRHSRVIFLSVVSLSRHFTTVVADIHVIGAGPPRSGTQSLTKALELLGFRVFSGWEYQLSVSNYRAWNGWLLDGGSFEPALQILSQGQYNATVDFPAYVAFAELARRFPEAKIVLGVRDSPEKWTDSFVGHIPEYSPIRHWGFWVVLRMLGFSAEESHGDARLRNIAKFNDCDIVLMHKSDPQQHPEIQDRCVQRYLQHIAEVKRTIPAERLLVHNAKEGWAPLCKFLDLPIPDEPYPWSDNAKATYLFMIYLPYGVALVCCCCCIRRLAPRLISRRAERVEKKAL